MTPQHVLFAFLYLESCVLGFILFCGSFMSCTTKPPWHKWFPIDIYFIVLFSLFGPIAVVVGIVLSLLFGWKWISNSKD